jgi:hypothetical protein
VRIYLFSYPPLSFVLQPLGILKLLPYYTPIVLFILLLLTIFQKTTDKRLAVLFLPLAGFFTTVFPTSDLLHVYPYFGLSLVSLFLFMKLRFPKFEKIGYAVIILCVISGFYLTLFREYYRGQPPYSLENTSIHTPKAGGILIDKTTAQNINSLYAFINSHTKKHEYIFVYSFSPAIYFLLDRQNPSRYTIYYPGYLTMDEEYSTIRDIQKRKVKYIIADWQSDFGNTTPLSAWVLKNKKLRQFGNQYTLYSTKM